MALLFFAGCQSPDADRSPGGEADFEVLDLSVADSPSIRIGFQPERGEETFGRIRETMEDPPLAEWIRVADEEPLERVRTTTYLGILSPWIGHDWIPTIKTIPETNEQYVGLHRLRRPGEAGDG